MLYEVITQSRYDEVSVVGLSMGGVIAILLAAEFRPAKIVLLAPAVAVRKAIFYFTPILKFILPKIKRKKDGPAEYDEDRKVLQREYWSHRITSYNVCYTKLLRVH